MFDSQNNSYTLSFRSTEPRSSLEGGDVERDGLSASGLTLGADGEIAWTALLLAINGHGTLLPRFNNEWKVTARALLNVTGFSLGGHLATVFTELHSGDVAHTYVFNAVGRDG